jgi:hypothetical protein
MLTEWSFEKHGVYLFSLYKVGINQNRYKKKDGKEGEALRGWKFWHDHVSQERKEDVIFLSLM